MIDKKKPKKSAVADDEVTPVERPVVVLADLPAADVPATVCTVCGTLRLGLEPSQPCPVDGFAPVAP